MSERVESGRLRQRVGRRLGLLPYYRIVEHTEGRLHLESIPEANHRPGLNILAVGVSLILIAAVIFGSGTLTSAQGGGFGVLAISAAIAGVLVSLGLQRIVGGYAVLTTRNQIIIDAAQQELTFTQSSRVGKPRQQNLAFAQVATIRLRRRPLVVGSLLRQMRPIVALELIVDGEIWVVDSAENDDNLQEIAVTLHKVMGRDL